MLLLTMQLERDNCYSKSCWHDRNTVLQLVLDIKIAGYVSFWSVYFCHMACIRIERLDHFEEEQAPGAPWRLRFVRFGPCTTPQILRLPQIR